MNTASSPSSSPPSPPPSTAGGKPNGDGSSPARADDDDTSSPPPPTPPIPEPQQAVRGLEGGIVDELGNVVNRQGAVIGRVQGDLPAMVGRPVVAGGCILDVHGRPAGYVQESFVGNRRRLGSGLCVDDTGTIYDADGQPVGTLNLKQAASPSGPGPGLGSTSETASAGPGPGSASAGSKARPQHAPSPSEVCLDIKSTHDGIQLIIKIPTVFNGGAPVDNPST
ncbi:hypothetical protein XA68_17724 [Ophiocordyceps unilateralis]|uniref:Uncharacterized protein n=1 Tax=Ophiocordyceps unilateralis TaxID=268505 RepID=A0A2A9P4E0_OPHUN|nr:hypothetical protein XA68_17724 [Ophiocordyceps unilateralis]